MKNQYDWLIIIIVLAVIAIASLQSYLIYIEYVSKTADFNKDINIAFKKAVDAELQIRRDSMNSFFRNVLTDTSRVEIIVSFDEEDQRNIYSIKDRDADSPYTSISYSSDKSDRNLADSLKKANGIELIIKSQMQYMENRTIYHWTERIGPEIIAHADSLKTDTLLLKNRFTEFLKEENINTPFIMKYSDSDSLNNEEDRIATNLLSTGLRVSKPYAYAEFENPFYDILTRIKFTLSGTVFILMFTLTCFLLMYRIILKQKKLSEMKDDFIANISHELQTPLATISTAIESMESFGVLNNKEKTLKYLTISRIEVDRLSKMIDYILNTTVSDQNGLKGDFETTNLIDFLMEIKSDVLLKTTGAISINISASDEYQEVELDKFHFRNLINNLIDNSIKYSLSDPVIVNIDCQSTNQKVKIIFSDNGPGIKNQHHKYLFDKFYRMPNHDIHNVKGHGIGLHYVKNIVSMHQGEIIISPYNGNGTTFEITLPITQFE